MWGPIKVVIERGLSHNIKFVLGLIQIVHHFETKITSFHNFPQKSYYLRQIFQSMSIDVLSLSFHLCPLVKRDIFHPWTLIRDSKNKVAQLCQWVAQFCQYLVFWLNKCKNSVYLKCFVVLYCWSFWECLKCHGT